MGQNKELKIIREFDVPRNLLFKMWIEPKFLEKWWGPAGFTNPICVIDAKGGGEIFIEMQAPDGISYPMDGMFKEIVEPEKLVFMTAALDEKMERIFEVLHTVTFTEKDNKTILTIHALVSKAKPGADQYLDGMEQGWGQSLDRLEVSSQNLHLHNTIDPINESADREMVITRVLNAPIELVWKVWTEPDHIKNWWGPNGFTNTIEKMEVKPGGVWDLIMHGPDGKDYPNKSMYVEVEKHRKIVIDHLAPKFRVTVTFAEHRKKTLLTWRMLFENAKQLQHVIKEFRADEGQKQNVDKLESYLAKI